MCRTATTVASFLSIFYATTLSPPSFLLISCGMLGFFPCSFCFKKEKRKPWDMLTKYFMNSNTAVFTLEPPSEVVWLKNGDFYISSRVSSQAHSRQIIPVGGFWLNLFLGAFFFCWSCMFSCSCQFISVLLLVKSDHIF